MWIGGTRFFYLFFLISKLALIVYVNYADERQSHPVRMLRSKIKRSLASRFNSGSNDASK